MTVRLYRSDDTDAPSGITNAAGSLIAVLDACLVSGYGAKAAAGWSKAYSGTNKAAYRQGNGNLRYLRVDDTGTTTARVRGYESMTDVDTGTGPVPTEAQVSGGLYQYKSSSATARPWVVVADENFFILWVGSNNGTAPSITSGITTQYEPAMMFGDFESYVQGDIWNTLIVAAASASMSADAVGGVNAVGAPNASTVSGHYVFRAIDQTTQSKAVGKGSPLVGSAIGAAGIAYPSPLASEMALLPLFVVEAYSTGVQAGVYRGRIKGLYCPWHGNPASHGDTFSGFGASAGKQFILLNLTYGGGAQARGAIQTNDGW